MPRPNRPTDKLKWAGVQNPHARTSNSPVWKGPEEDGITFSLLSRFLVCRERFRLLVVEGLTTLDTFNHRLQYGQMWHTCEEALAANYPWERALATYCQNLARRYKAQVDEVDKWYNVCLRQFPIYLQYWEDHPDTVTREPLLQEFAFNVPYQLPSGRTVRLRGKWDSVDLIGKGKTRAIYLQENKTKGDINEAQIKRQLTFDLQTMTYLTALNAHRPNHMVPVRDPVTTALQHLPIAGVRYNVVRRPLSGGKGTIVQGKGTQGSKCGKCKGTGLVGRAGQVPYKCDKCQGAGRTGGTPPESKEAYYDRLAKYIVNEPETFFMRWTVEVGQHDIEKFRRECLDPILESLCIWWGYVKDDEDPWRTLWVDDYSTREASSGAATGVVPGVFPFHWRHPFGVYNVLDEGGSTDVDEYLASGSLAGLERTTNLFPELS